MRKLLYSLLGLFLIGCGSETLQTEPSDKKAELNFLEETKLLIEPSQEFVEAAKTQFSTSHSGRCQPMSGPAFQANYNFPETVPDVKNTPWEDIDFKTSPEEYMRAVLAQAVSDNDGNDWNVRDAENGWYHAPWMHTIREPYRGLTRERGSRRGHLHEQQTETQENWAIGYYNDIAAVTFSDIWADRSIPQSAKVEFAENSATIKLLFTEADAEDAPYLTNPKTWNACLFDSRNGTHRMANMNLLQIDIGVKVGLSNSPTGWIMGTFVYWNEDADTDFSWENMKAVSLHWGNDPELTLSKFKAGERPQEGWTNTFFDEQFGRIRDAAGVSNMNEKLLTLGLFGRANGPVDNPLSACLACHARAIDPGQSLPSRSFNEAAPFAISDITKDEEITNLFFRNLEPNEPFVEGWHSLDYSLQAAVGLRAYRRWVFQNYREYDCVLTDQDDLPNPALCPAGSKLMDKAAENAPLMRSPVDASSDSIIDDRDETGDPRSGIFTK